MIVINEWLPNPKGPDAPNEWVELRNTAGVPVDLSGWSLTADGKKFFKLSGEIGPGAYAVLPRTETKITLRNTDGRLALYDSSGRLMDQISFLGSAPEGESANRSSTPGTIFFGKPTPGTANVKIGTGGLIRDSELPINMVLNPMSSGIFGSVGFLIGTALALAAALVFILKSHENLSRIIFKRDQNS